MVGFMFFLDLVLAVLAYGLFVKKVNIIKLVVPSTLLFFMCYVVIAGILWWADSFSVLKTLVGVGLINIICIVCVIRNFKAKTIQIQWEIKEYIIPIAILLCALPFTIQKFEYFGMGQDEGVYQTQAIQFMYGHTKGQQDIDEYTRLETIAAKQEFKLSAEENLTGFYNYDCKLPFASMQKEVSEVSGVFHGVATFPAILALWGEMFGISHMSDIQTIFWAGSIFLCFFILQQLKIKKWLMISITALFAFSPLILWVSKSALTEMMLTAMITLFIYFILKKERKYILCSIIPLAAFCFFHITIYTVIPCFLLLYFGMYFCTCDKKYIYAAIVLNTFFAAGIFMIMMTARTYSFSYNFRPIYNIIPGITEKNIVWMIIGCCIVVYLVCFILLKIKNKTYIKKIVAKYRNIGIKIVLVVGIVNQIRVVLSLRENYHGGIEAIRHLSLMGICMAVGVIVPALAGIIFLIFTKKIAQNIHNTVIIWLFLYCIVFYCSVMKTHIEYYYYYGRYLAPYLIITLLVSAIALNNFSGKVIGTAVICSFLFILPYDLLFLRQQDDTRMEWKILEAIPSYVSESDAVLVSEEDMKYFFFAVRAMTGAEVYPCTETMYENIKKSSDVNNIYCLDSNSDNTEDVIYESTYIMEQDNNNYKGKIFPFPTKMESEERRFAITQIK